MSERHDSVEQAAERLRRLLREHERCGGAETPFFRGIREALAERDDYEAGAESTAA